MRGYHEFSSPVTNMGSPYPHYVVMYIHHRRHRLVWISSAGQMVVGWYHSHPGFGCWLSGVDINTQQSFEQLNARAVSIVVDPIQSVKGKVRLVRSCRFGCVGGVIGCCRDFFLFFAGG